MREGAVNMPVGGASFWAVAPGVFARPTGCSVLGFPVGYGANRLAPESGVDGVWAIAAVVVSASAATAWMAKPVTLSGRRRRDNSDLLVPTERSALAVRRATRRPAPAAVRRSDG